MALPSRKASRLSRRRRASCGCRLRERGGGQRPAQRKRKHATINLPATFDVVRQRVLVRVIDERAAASERQPGSQWHR